VLRARKMLEPVYHSTPLVDFVSPPSPQCYCSSYVYLHLDLAPEIILPTLFCCQCVWNFCCFSERTSVCSYGNPLTPNDPYRGRTTPLTSKRRILYIYSTNICTEYFKHGTYLPFFFLQNAVCFIILTYLVPVLFTFYIQCVLKFKKIIPAPKG